MPDALANWLNKLPGWEDARIEPLTGARSKAWRLEVEGRTAVLKLDPLPRAEPYNTRAEEASLQACAATEGLAAPVYWSSTEGLLTAWLEGNVLAPHEFEDSSNVLLLAASLKSLHGLPVTGRRYDFRAWADHYRTILESASSFNESLESDWALLTSLVLPGDRCFSHNDLVPANMVAGDGMIRFIDWEYAADNSPLFDLATVIVEAGLDSEMRDLLTARYFDGQDVPDDDIDLAIAAYKSLVRLWEACGSPGVA